MKKISNWRWRLVSLVLLIGLVIPAIAGAAIFVSIPNVPGESTQTGFRDQIAADSISMGYNSPVDAALGKQVDLFVAPVTITKKLDKSTTALMNLGGQGTRIAQMVVSHTLNGTASTTPPLYLKVTMTNVAITDWQLIGTTDDNVVREQITFQPTSVSVEYTQLSSTGAIGPKFTGRFEGRVGK